MRAWLRNLRYQATKLRRAYDRRFGATRLKRALAASPNKKIVLGASNRYDPGWIPTEVEFLNVVRPADWDRFFAPDSIEAILAEHVWEHLTEEGGSAAAESCFKYLKPGGYLRAAVPDGLHPDATYRELVKVGLHGHRMLYTYCSFRKLFETYGFRVELYEYFDEAGTFHDQDWDEKRGTIWRSKRFDKRNSDGNLRYTSIVLDAVKDS
jgi:predicted SAM-dependent methyltransferase